MSRLYTDIAYKYIKPCPNCLIGWEFHNVNASLYNPDVYVVDFFLCMLMFVCMCLEEQNRGIPPDSFFDLNFTQSLGKQNCNPQILKVWTFSFWL